MTTESCPCYLCQAGFPGACILIKVGKTTKIGTLTGTITDIRPLGNDQYELTIELSNGHIYRRTATRKDID